jgi:hypothetical protein
MTVIFVLSSLLYLSVARHHDSGTAVRYRSWVYTLYVHASLALTIIANFSLVDVDNFGK